MSTKHVIEQLSLYIDNALSQTEKQAVEAHLKECQSCRQELEQFKATQSLLTQWHAPSPDSGFEQEVSSRILEWERKKEAAMKPRWRLRVIPETVILGIVGFSLLIGLQVYVRRGMQARVRDAGDQIGKQFEGGSATYDYKTITSARVKEKADAWSTVTNYEGQSMTRSGTEVIGDYKSLFANAAPLKRELFLETIPRSRYMVAETSVDMSVINPPQFHTEEYDRIYENRFLEVLQNPLSTFSIDVDTASYSNLRRFINSNQLPPQDAVRIEEIINYFTYDYPQPAGDAPFSINMEIAGCPWNAKHNIVLIGLQGKKIKTETLPPSNLVFLFDVSGSMDEPNKLPLLQSAFRLLVEQLKPEDRVAIVVYAGAAGLVLDSTTGYDKAKILDAIDRLQAGGSTAGGAGVKLAYEIAKRNYIADGNNRVILATDGDFNVGVSSDAELVRLIEEKRKEGVFLTVLGFGTGNYKDSKMEQLADKGNGNYAYIDSILEAKKVFVSELGATLFTIAKDVKIQIEFNPAKIKAYRLIGYENRMLQKEDFNDDTKDAGELGAGHTVTALYEIVMADSEEEFASVDDLKYQETKVAASDDLMAIKLRYKEPDEDESKLLSQTITTKDIEKENTSNNFTFATAVAEFGMLLRDSEHKGSASYKHVLEQARTSKGSDAEGYRAEFIKLVETAELLDNKK